MLARAIVPTSAALLLAAAACALASCGGSGGPSDAGDEGGVVVDAGPDAPQDATCSPANDAAEPALYTPPSWEAGVPLSQLPAAMASAMCGYWAKCSPLATYQIDACINTLTENRFWNFSVCYRIGGGTGCSGTWLGPFPGPSALQQFEAGTWSYDGAQGAACLAEIESEPCHGWQPITVGPACSAMFACPEGGAPDGAPCGSAGSGPTCSSDVDCADAGGGQCVGGICDNRPCQGFTEQADGGCATFVPEGQPCDSDPPLLGNALMATPWATWPSRICAPGLTCRGLAQDGGLGACAVASEVGQSCAPDVVGSGCALGLVCQCGACALPPTEGPCVDAQCRGDVAYCDQLAGQCAPLVQEGGSCSNPFMCAPDLTCSGNTCGAF